MMQSTQLFPERERSPFHSKINELRNGSFFLLSEWLFSSNCIFQWQLKWANKGDTERNPVLRLPPALYTGCIRWRNTFEILPECHCSSAHPIWHPINHSSSFFCVHLPLTLWFLSSTVETYFLAPWTKADIIPCLAKKSKTELGQIHAQVWSHCLSWNPSQPPWVYLNWSAEGEKWLPHSFSSLLRVVLVIPQKQIYMTAGLLMAEINP